MADNLAKREALLKSIKASQETIAKWQDKATQSGKDYTKSIEKSEKALEASLKKLREINKENRRSIDFASEQEKSIASIGSEYSSFSKAQRDVLESTKSISKLSAPQTEFLDNYLSNTRDLASLSREDSNQIAAKLEYLDQELIIAGQLFGANSEIVKSLEKQKEEATAIASLGKSQQEQLRAQVEAYNKIKKAVGGVFDTMRTLTSGVSGFFATILAGAGFLVGKIGKVNKELGTSFNLSMGFANQTALLSIFFDDAVENAKVLSKELGGMDKSSFGTRLNMSLIAKAFGISGPDASKLTAAFSYMNDNSVGIAQDMLATSREFAKQNNIIPAQLMGDLAASTEEFALFGRDGGTNMLRAAGYAAKLGVEMATLSGVADNLLDFESSITKELELGAMLGRNINLNRARALAYEGKIGEATLETLNAVGGIDAFNKMDYFAKKQTAATLGVSVAQLQKMASLQEKGVNLSEVTAENFDQMKVGGEGLVNEFGGKFLNVLSGAVASTGQILSNMMQTRKLSKVMQATQSIGGGGTGIPFTSAMNKPTMGPMPQQTLNGGGLQQTSKGVSGFSAKNVLAGAAAMLIVAGAMWVLGKAVQEFGEAKEGAVTKMIGSLAALTISMLALGMAFGNPAGAGLLLAAAGGMILIAGAMWVLGKALQENAKGFDMITDVAMRMMPLIGMAGSIALLGASFAALGYGLMMLGTLGSVAIPVLLALGALGAVAGSLGIFGESSQSAESEMTLAQHNTNMINKLEEIRVAVGNGSIIKVDGDVLGKTTTKKQDSTVYNTAGDING